MSEDPIGLAGGINPYTFAGNDPVNLRDPRGLDLEVVGDSAFKAQVDSICATEAADFCDALEKDKRLFVIVQASFLGALCATYSCAGLNGQSFSNPPEQLGNWVGSMLAEGQALGGVSTVNDWQINERGYFLNDTDTFPIPFRSPADVAWHEMGHLMGLVHKVVPGAGPSRSGPGPREGLYGYSPGILCPTVFRGVPGPAHRC